MGGARWPGQTRPDRTLERSTYSKPVGALGETRELPPRQRPTALALETDFLVMHTSWAQITMWHPVAHQDILGTDFNAESPRN